jgi:hypothetical protein
MALNRPWFPSTPSSAMEKKTTMDEILELYELMSPWERKIVLSQCIERLTVQEFAYVKEKHFSKPILKKIRL